MASPEFHLHFLLHSATLIEERLRQRLAAVNLLPRQARVIAALDRLGKASQVELARQFDVSPASMSTMTSRLISAGHISREVDPNEARCNILCLTAQGQRLLVEIHAAWRDIDALIQSRLGPENAHTLAQLTRDLRDQLGGRAPGQSAPGQSAPDKTPPNPKHPEIEVSK